MLKRSASGAGAALLAYAAWGLLPAYWKQLGAVPPAEVLANRVVFSVLSTLALLAALGRGAELGVFLVGELGDHHRRDDPDHHDHDEQLDDRHAPAGGD